MTPIEAAKWPRCVNCGSPNLLGPCIHYDNGSDTEAAVLCAWCSDEVHAERQRKAELQGQGRPQFYDPEPSA